MAEEVVALGNDGTNTPLVQDVPQIDSFDSPEIPEEVSAVTSDPTRLGSLVGEPEVVVIPEENVLEERIPAEPVPAETPPLVVDNPLVSEEQELRRHSRLLHILLSVGLILLGVGGAATAAYFYSRSDATFIKLPKLPFVKEPMSDVEKGEQAAPTETEVNKPEVTELVPETEVTANPEPEVAVQPEAELANPDTTKGGLPLDTTDWKFFQSKSWGFSLKYPTDWYLYPRDVGSMGEATMVASSPLSSLENDLRQVNVKAEDLVIGVGVISKDKPLSQTTLQYLRDKASLYGISAPEEVTVARREFVRALTTQGGVMNYYISADQVVYFISIKPADYASKYADQVETIVGGLTLN